MTLPNFLIIGAAKAGTTSLHRYLDQHPQIFMCPEKEPNFFADDYDSSGIWVNGENPPQPPSFRAKTLYLYEELFAGVTNEIAIGETSPRYFSGQTTPQRIRDCIPNVKLVASLRNPADRAFSGFLMRVRKGRMAMNVRSGLKPESHHVREGFYYIYLKHYLDIFPKDQIKVILYEDFKEDGVKVLQDLFDFLGVDKDFVPDTTVRHNSAAIPKHRWLNRLFYHPALIRTARSMFPENIQGMLKQIRQLNQSTPPNFPAELRAELLKLYREDILKLEVLLDRDLSLWLN